MGKKKERKKKEFNSYAKHLKSYKQECARGIEGEEAKIGKMTFVQSVFEMS